MEPTGGKKASKLKNRSLEEILRDTRITSIRQALGKSRAGKKGVITRTRAGKLDKRGGLKTRHPGRSTFVSSAPTTIKEGQGSEREHQARKLGKRGEIEGG